MTDVILPRLTMVTIGFELEAQDTVSLPRYTGATLRGSIGNALRDLACLTGFKTCDGCPQVHHCTYGAMWEEPPPDLDMPTRYRAPPRPYVLEPVDHRGQHDFSRGERLRFRLKLFGRARNEVPHIVLAVRNAARAGIGRGRSRLELVRAWAEDEGAEHVLLYDAHRFHKCGELPERTVTPTVGALDVALAEIDAPIRLRLATPMQIKSKEKFDDVLDLVAVTARLTERLDAMSRAHEGVESTWDFMALRDAARAVTVVRSDITSERFDRYSTRSNKRIPMFGLVGDVTVRTVSPQLLALWRCADHIHAGKQATFGFGKVRVEVS